MCFFVKIVTGTKFIIRDISNLLQYIHIIIVICCVKKIIHPVKIKVINLTYKITSSWSVKILVNLNFDSSTVRVWVIIMKNLPVRYAFCFLYNTNYKLQLSGLYEYFLTVSCKYLYNLHLLPFLMMLMYGCASGYIPWQLLNTVTSVINCGGTTSSSSPPSCLLLSVLVNVAPPFAVDSTCTANLCRDSACSANKSYIANKIILVHLLWKMIH